MFDKEDELSVAIELSEEDRAAYEARELEYQAWASSEPEDFGYDGYDY